MALGVAVFFVPRKRTVAQVAALAGALVVALQLTADHWFWFYLVWLAPLALVGLMGAYSTTSRPTGRGLASPAGANSTS